MHGDHKVITDSLSRGSSTIPSTDFVRVRIFRQSDSKAVRRLFLTCLLTGEGAPTRAHLAVTLRSPAFLNALKVLIVSTVIATITFNAESSTTNGKGYPGISTTKGMSTAIAFSALCYLCYAIYSSLGFYVGFVLTCLRTDLVNIRKHYNLRPIQSLSDKIHANEEPEGLLDPELGPAGVKAFWVAEIVSSVTNKAEIVGCISLNDPPPPPFTEPNDRVAELCRMVISPYHRRKGIAGALIKACETHAMASEYQLSAIVLRTTFYQPHARELYAKLGYRIALEKTIHFGNADIPVFLYRKELTK
ncbi:hypothetical protein EV361DRAFT_273175 [Lentinula raphanica]|uniref:Probable N-acetyltransferase 14 n=1 Tax=Lentinula raphanica TaxID=153919 RepID=A0AA38UFX0_9AGAR|nr:hypothetical protein C8R42DRAFT_717451 [Lentinula raphanica]KAJ3774540.1 hypothetical protein FB446DRAFT_786805 [Lentinula raphanica]KAJ3818616.1 hypothetical protein F5880DRAFT_1215780 [Lentinula raphanica]KAJ3840029.1 hypothetical protein F5878DRAFT_614367 [Lentinula raphanica]KAJ3970585.1 hypothetical protein EV361DRAFT_273175 [Lentinula raphanica]